MFKNINLDKNSLLLILIIVLSNFGSFGLGRLSVFEDKKQQEDVKIIVPKLSNLDIDETKFAFVASKNGTKYYPINCKSASRIKTENKIYFLTEDEAKDSGLERSSTCSF